MPGSSPRASQTAAVRAPAVALASLLFAASPQAADIAGVSFPETVRLNGTELVNNGAGLRSKIFGSFKIYAMALYLPRKESAAESVIAGREPKSIVIVFLRDRTGPQFVTEIEDGIAANRKSAGLRALQGRLGRTANVLRANGPFPKGTTIQLDWLPESGTRASIDGRAIGELVPGKDFYDALLEIWIGDSPIQASLKKALLNNAP
jgi:hypothetical protein